MHTKVPALCKVGDTRRTLLHYIHASTTFYYSHLVIQRPSPPTDGNKLLELPALLACDTDCHIVTDRRVSQSSFTYMYCANYISASTFANVPLSCVCSYLNNNHARPSAHYLSVVALPLPDSCLIWCRRETETYVKPSNKESRANACACDCRKEMRAALRPIWLSHDSSGASDVNEAEKYRRSRGPECTEHARWLRQHGWTNDSTVAYRPASAPLEVGNPSPASCANRPAKRSGAFSLRPDTSRQVP